LTTDMNCRAEVKAWWFNKPWCS